MAVNDSLPYIVEEVEGIVKLRCSDARDAGALESHIKHALEIEYMARGVKPDMTSLSLAGTFMTPDVALEIESILHRLLNTHAGFDRKGLLTLTVQIFGHGGVTSRDELDVNKIFYPPEELAISRSVKFNCGMGHARDAWEKFLEEIQAKGLKARYYDRAKREEVEKEIHRPDEILELLRNVYLFEGDDVRQFVSSIDDLIQHPLTQKAILRQLLDKSFELANVPIHLNAAVVHYGTGFCPRIDGNEHVYTFLDDVALLRRTVLSGTDLPEKDAERVRRTSPQKDTVTVCLISSGTVDSARTKVAKWFTANGMETDVAGGVFAIITKNASQQYTPFGSYKAVAFFYAAHPDLLGIKRFAILGETREEAERMLYKLKSDPLMNFVIEKYGITFKVLTQSDIALIPSMPDSDTHKRNEKYREIVRKALRELAFPERSVLNKPVINRDLGRLCVRKP